MRKTKVWRPAGHRARLSLPGRRASRSGMLTSAGGVSDNANMCSSSSRPLPAAPASIRELARRHGLDAIRWWPPNEGDVLVEGIPLRLRQLRSDLERALGCKVTIYVADTLAEDVRRRLEEETVDLLAGAPAA